MKKYLLFFWAVFASMTAFAATGDYFISGNFNKWKHANIQFEQSGTTYSVTLDGTGLEPFSGAFLICGGTQGTPQGTPDWNDKIGGVTNMEVDTEYTYIPGGSDFTVKGIIAYPLTVTFNTETKKIKITGATVENDYDTVYVVGNFGDGWDESRTDAALSLKAGTTNVWEGTVTFTGDTNYFKLKAGSYVYGTGGDDIEVELGEQYTLPQSGNAFTLAAGTYNFSFVLDKNADTGELTVTSEGGGGGYEYQYSNVDLCVNFGTYLAMTQAGEGIWEYTGNLNKPSLITVKANNKSVTFGSADQEAVTEAGTLYTLTQTAGCLDFELESGEYIVTFNEKDLTIKFETVGDEPIPYDGWYFNFGTASFMDENNQGFFRGKAIPENGIVEYGEVELGTAAFQIKIWDGTDDQFYAATPSAIPANTPVVLSAVDFGEMTVAGATAGTVYDVKWDMNSCTLTMTGEGGEVTYEVYLAGDFNDWSATANKFTSTDGKNFTLSLDELKEEFKVVKNGEWLGSNADSIELTTEYVLSVIDGAGNMHLLDQNATDLTLNFNAETNTLKINGTPGGGGSEGFTAVDIEFGFGSGVYIPMIKEDDGNWVYEGIVDADDVYLWCNNETYEMYESTEPIEEVGKAYNMVTGLHAFNPCTLPVGEYKVVFNENNMTLTFNKLGEEEAFYGVHGDIFGGTWSTLNLTNEDGKWVGSATVQPGNFGIKIMDASGEQTGWIGGNATVTEADTAYTIVDGENSSSTLEGDYKITYDPAAGTIMFTAAEIEKVITYALHGTIFGGTEWISKDLAKEGDAWKWSGEVVPGSFGIKELTNGLQSNWFNAANGETAMDGNGDYTATDFGGENWVSTIEGSCTFSFNPETNVLTVSDVSGMIEINAENGNVKYFNLQGVEVANPSNGIFIRVENGKTSKVVK